MVLQHELLSVVPVIGDLAGVVVAHDVGLPDFAAVGRVGVFAVLGRALSLGDEAIHLAAIDVRRGVTLAVRPAPVEIGGVVVRRDALPRGGIVHAHRGHAILHGDAICTRKGAEVAVEGAVLLHDHNDMLDLMYVAGSDSLTRLGQAGRAES